MLLASCKAGPGTVAKRPLVATGSPAPNSPPAASAAVVPAAKLVKPADTTRVLRGNLELDASYVVSSGGGGVRDGGIDVRGGAAMPDQGNLIATAGQIIARGGQTLISNNGGNVIANNGGNVISDHASGLTSKVKRRLLADGDPAPGELLPVRGALVGLVSLADGRPVPVGVDEAGKPVYMVHANAKGEFELYPPQGQAGNLLVVASLPDNTDRRLAIETATSADNPASLVVDEVSTTTIEHLRETIANDLEQDVGYKGAIGENIGRTLGGALAKPIVDDYKATLLSPELAKLSQPRLHRVMRHVADMALAQVELEQVEIDPTIARGFQSTASGKAIDVLKDILVKFDQAAADKLKLVPATPYPPGENYFTRQPYVEAANVQRAADLRFSIERASDVTALMVGAYLTVAQARVRGGGGDQLLADLGIPPSLKADAMAASESLFRAMHVAVFLKVDRAEMRRVVLEDAAREFAEQQAGEPMPTPLPTATPMPSPTPEFIDIRHYEGQVTVSTVEVANGGKTNVIGRMAFDSAGNLYADGTDGKPLRLTPDGQLTVLNGLGSVSTHPVGFFDKSDALFTLEKGRIVKRTALDSSSPNTQTVFDGAAQAIEIDGYSDSVAMDALDRLYFCSLDKGWSSATIWRKQGANDAEKLATVSSRLNSEPSSFALDTQGALAFRSDKFYKVAPDGQVTRLMDGEEGYVDGPAATARFGDDIDMVFDPAGNLIIADAENQVVRMFLPTGKVVTLAGYLPSTEREYGAMVGGFADGDGRQARFKRPNGLALGKDGAIYVADYGNGQVRKIVYR